MRKKQFLQFRRAMATLLAVAMIGQNTVMTTAENYVADNTAVVAEEQAQEPEVQVEESASPAVQESAPAAETPAEPAAQAVAETPAEPAAQAVAETPAEPAAQAVAETPAEPAAQAVAETPAEPAAQAVAETPAEPAAQAVAEKPAEPAAQAVAETPEKPAGQTVAETPAEPTGQAVAEKPAEPAGQTVADSPEPAQNNRQEESKPEEQPAASDSGENKDQTNVENGAENSQESQPSEEAKEILYHVTFDEHAADFGKIQVRGEGAPVENISSYRKEVKENDLCPKCQNKLTFKKGIEIGNTFKLGTKYSSLFDLNYTDKDNNLMPVLMGCYGIGLGRCLSSIVEQKNDDKGIIWPISIAPYKVAIIITNMDNDSMVEAGNHLYQIFKDAKIDVLLDDRNVRAGVKFNDMDLIGIPIRIVIGNKINEHIVEIKQRNSDEVKEISIFDVLYVVQDIIEESL